MRKDLMQVAPPTSSFADARPALIAGTDASSLSTILEQLRVRQRKTGTSFGANLGSALDGLWSNRTRSFLTALGIFVGVAAVIAALTLTQGVNAFVNDQLALLGSSIIISGNAVSNQGGISQGSSAHSTLTLRDAASLRELPNVTAVSPVITVSSPTIYNNQNWTTQIQGVNADYQTIQNLQMAQGSWFSLAEDTSGTPVAVLGDTVMHNLFDASGDSPLGKQFRIGSQVFRIEGVLSAQGGGFSQDDVVYVPLKAAQQRLKNLPTVDQIQARVDAVSDVAQSSLAVTAVLRKNHNISPGGTDDFTVLNFTRFLQQAGTGTTILTVLLVGIAAISLTVGGIGIMNIMLVSVVERTWEIGIRMAIGAQRRDIRNQFLIEALMLCIIGGVVGLGLGILIGWAVTQAGKLPFVVTPVTVLLPFAVSTAIALIFGIYPAIRASRLDPIVALRTEE